jgi:radical SAM protein with 4Fe4S-binding SPASM domain
MEDTKIYIDPSTNRKGKILNERIKTFKGIPLFSMIELNLLARCNRSCSFCPVSSETFYQDFYNNKLDKLEMELYEKLLNDLTYINYSGVIGYSGLSEPLLHPKINQFIARSKEVLRNARVEIVSNGDVLNKKRLNNLFNNGLDTISISMYDGPHQVEHFSKIKTELGLREDQIILRRRYYENENYGLTISNRAGLIDSNKFRSGKDKKVIKLPLRKVCFYPFYMLKIDFNGDVTICSHDWRKKGCVGNIKEENILDIWKGNAIKIIRKTLAKNDRNFSPCNECDVYGDLMGKEHFDQWNLIDR